MFVASAALLPQASSAAGPLDLLFTGITLVAVVFTVGVFLAITFLTVRYRRGAKVDRSNAPTHNIPIELAWTFIPAGIAVGIFAWSAFLYFRNSNPPPGAMDVYVVGKQWMWKAQQPNGRWENNQLHVPVGKPVRLTLTSEDVIHSFFVPAFRLKMDVIPGQYTQMWFTPTKPGTYRLFCAEFCGTLHSTMIGEVIVQEPAEYQAWLNQGPTPESLAESGARLFRAHGCSGCHAPNASVRAPLLEGVYNSTVPVQIPKPGVPLEQVQATTVLADSAYIHDSIVFPEKMVRGGFRPIMPSYRNRISEEEILQIVSYIKTLANQPVGTTGTGGDMRPSRVPSPEEYKARTGFTPSNMNQIQGGNNRPTPGQPGRPGGGQPGSSQPVRPSGQPSGVGGNRPGVTDTNSPTDSGATETAPRPLPGGPTGGNQ